MSQTIVTRSLQLVPVLELDPGMFAVEKREMPNLPWREDPEGWDRYWRASLADAGITELHPFPSGSWCVPVASIVGEELILKIDRVLNPPDSDGKAYAMDVSGLGGGYALFIHGEARVLPSCCGSLANIHDWRAAAQHRGADWLEVWTGHPSISVRYDGGRLRFSEVIDPPRHPTSIASEERAPRPEIVPSDLTVDPDELARAVELADPELRALDERWQWATGPRPEHC